MTSSVTQLSLLPASVTLSDMPGYRLIAMPESRRDEVIDTDAWAFGAEFSDDLKEVMTDALVWDRSVGAEDENGQLAGFSSSYPLTLPTPGGSVVTSGLTWVMVHPTHRRRGILRSMIERHFQECIERSEPVSALWAMETSIYQRFGYGMAATGLELTLPAHLALNDVPGSEECTVKMERLDVEKHEQLLENLHRTLSHSRPGWITRDSEALQRKMYQDFPEHRGGAEQRRIAIVERGGQACGYAFFRRKEGWKDGNPDWTIQISEPVVADAAVARALWGTLLNLDLIGSASVRQIAPDDPLMTLALDVRSLKAQLCDNIFVRLIDIPQALMSRTYQCDLDVVLAIDDPVISANTGRYRLNCAGGTVNVERTEKDPDLSLDVTALGAAYLGGTSLNSLAGSGRVRELTPGTLRAASIAFGSDLAPYCSWIF